MPHVLTALCLYRTMSVIARMCVKEDLVIPRNMNSHDLTSKDLAQCTCAESTVWHHRTTSVSALMYVKEDLIIPHHISFYDLISSKARGKSGPLFHFDVHEDIRAQNDARIEKDESHAGELTAWHFPTLQPQDRITYSQCFQHSALECILQCCLGCATLREVCCSAVRAC